MNIEKQSNRMRTTNNIQENKQQEIIWPGETSWGKENTSIIRNQNGKE